MYRNSCSFYNNGQSYYKDLCKITKDLSSILIVDNSALNFALQVIFLLFFLHH